MTTVEYPQGCRAFWILICLIPFSACSNHAPDTGDVVARVGKASITTRDVSRALGYLQWAEAHPDLDRTMWSGTTCGSAALEIGLVAPDDMGGRLPDRKRALDFLIDQALAEQAATKKHMAVNDRDLDILVTRLESFGEGAEPFLATRLIADDPPLREFLRKRLLASCYWQATVFDLIQVSDLDMMNYAGSHPGALPPGMDSNAFDEMRPVLEPVLRKILARSAIEARLSRLRRSFRIQAGDAPGPGT